MRVLLSFEKNYRVYGQAVAAAIREFRPDVEVAVVDEEDLEEEAERFDPQLVIRSPAASESPVDDRLACIELSPDPDQPSRFRVGDRQWETTNLRWARYCRWSTRPRGCEGKPTSKKNPPPTPRGRAADSLAVRATGRVAPVHGLPRGSSRKAAW